MDPADPSAEYREGPNLFWTIKLFDRVFVTQRLAMLAIVAPVAIGLALATFRLLGIHLRTSPFIEREARSGVA